MKSKEEYLLKVPLLISAVVVTPVALVYGFNPQFLLEINFITNDEQSFSKGVMGLYLAFAILWCFGVFNPKYLKAALLSNCLFMLGLALGRMISIIYDGWPTEPYLIGIFGELTLGVYSAIILNSKYGRKLS